MWVVVPIGLARRSKRFIGTDVMLKRRHDGSYVIGPARRAKNSKIAKRQVIIDGSMQLHMLECALHCDRARPPTRCIPARRPRGVLTATEPSDAG
jgi:hypothetical protein